MSDKGDIFRTSLPITYVIDYGEDHLERTDEFIRQLAQAPPHLLHLGHDAPFSNTWGAAFRIVGSRTALVPPEDMRERIARIRDFVERLHAIRGRAVIPYICNQTLAGEPGQRTGVWGFYDHWDEYAEFGFGPKPEADPLGWMVRERNGQPHYNYEKKHVYFGRFNQYRFAPCPNNPYYNQYQRGIAANIAEVGFDGVFVDNCILNCYCVYCQGKFKHYLQAKYPPEVLKERFGFDDPSEISLGYRGSRLEWVKEEPSFRVFLREAYTPEELERWLGTSDLEQAPIEEGGNGWLWGRANEYRRYMEQRYPPKELERRFGARDLSSWGIRRPEDRALWAETKHFWAECIGENLTMIRAAGASIRGDFLIVPNWGAMQRIDGNVFRGEIAHDLRTWVPHSDYIMFEEDGEPGRIAHGLYLDYPMQYKFAFANRVRPGNLCYVGSEPNVIELAYAEATAGGGGVFIQAGTGFPEVRRKYQGFFETHPRLLGGYRSYADVALAHFYDQVHLGNLEHLRQVYALTRYLSDQHVLFDYLLEGDLVGEKCSRYRVIILPEVRYMDDRQNRAAQAFAEAGGILILTGETGAYTLDGRKRSKPLLERSMEDGKCVYNSDLRGLLPQDRLMREEALDLSKGDLAEVLDVPGNPRFYAMAELNRRVGVDRLLEKGRLLELLERWAGPLSIADPFEAAGVRFNAYAKEQGSEGHLVVHAVNYNLPLVGDTSGRAIIPVEHLKLRSRLPDGWEVRKVRIFEPNVQPQELEFKFSQFLEVTVPSVMFYKMIHVSAEIGRDEKV